MRVLLTRPDRDAQTTAAQLSQRGHVVLTAPVLRIVATNSEIPSQPCDAVLATSAHAVTLLAETSVLRLRETGALFQVVGSRTAEAVEHRRLPLASTHEDAAELATYLLAHSAARSRFLYLAGRDRKPKLEASLLDAGHSIETIIVYEACAETALADAAVQALRSGKIDAVLHYSRRSAALFLELARTAGAGDPLAWIAHICISHDAAAPLVAENLKVRVAAAPTSPSLFAALETV